MSDQWISVNKEEKAMVGHGVQAIGRSGRNPAHMFTGEGVYTTFSAANVENTFRTLAPALRYLNSSWPQTLTVRYYLDAKYRQCPNMGTNDRLRVDNES
jgi:hypothetical protein